jgi:hypothetical protein
MLTLTIIALVLAIPLYSTIISATLYTISNYNNDQIYCADSKGSANNNAFTQLVRYLKNFDFTTPFDGISRSLFPTGANHGMGTNELLFTLHNQTASIMAILSMFLVIMVL